MSFPNFVPDDEVVLATKLLNAILARGWAVTVTDEEREHYVDMSLDFDRISAETFATGITNWDIFEKPTGWLGTIVLIMGNGEDLISDMLVPASNPNELDNLIEGLF